MDYTTAMQQAHSAVEAANLPTDVRAAAFSVVLEHILGVEEPIGNAAKPGAPRLADPVSDAVASMAAKLGVDQTAVQRAFEIVDDKPVLTLPRSRLPKAKGPASRTIAVVLVAANQLGLKREWTQISTVKEACQMFGVLDPKNFSSYVKADNEIFIGRAKDGQRELKLTRQGMEEAATTIKSLAEGS